VKTLCVTAVVMFALGTASVWNLVQTEKPWWASVIVALMFVFTLAFLDRWYGLDRGKPDDHPGDSGE
jgi:hypothetical protein